MRRTWVVAVAGLLLTPLVTAGVPAPSAAAVASRMSVRQATWLMTAAGSAGSADQFATATITGLRTRTATGALVLRRSAPDTYIRVSFSGERYQIALVAGGRPTVVVSKIFAGIRSGGHGQARTEIRGTTVTSTWGGTLVSEDVIPGAAQYSGTGTGAAVKQGVRFAGVTVSAFDGGMLSPTNPAPGPTPVPTPSPQTATPTVPVPPSPASWLSGASGRGVPDGTFGAWRGRPMDIAGTWDDQYSAQANQWSTKPGGPYAAWQGNLEIAVGGIYKDRGDTWAAAASGAYDARWRAALQTLSRAWGNRPGTLYIRFAHEFNGDWYPWSVQPSETADFATAWRRFHAVQDEVLPKAKLVFCPNVETADMPGLDWRAAFPGSAYVDVFSVDAYNHFPYVSTREAFAATISRSDQYGAPAGLETHRQFASAMGLPFAVSEWSSNSIHGDSPVYIAELHAWFTRHAGVGPGRLAYEIQFNPDHGDRRFQLFPPGRQPLASATYAALW